MKQNLAARLGGWSTRHRKTAIFGWLLFVVLLAVVGGASGMVEMTNSEDGAGDSVKAEKILEDAGLDTPAGEMVMVRSAEPDGWQSVANQLTTDIKQTGEVDQVKEPVRSDSGREGLITFDMKGDADTSSDRVDPVMEVVDKAAKSHKELEVYQFGEASSGTWLDTVLSDDMKKAEFTAVPLALGILLVVFGAVVAALLPVILALTACVATFGVLALVSHQMHLTPTINSVMFLVGLAVGVDYCLFYLRRERDERAAGRDAETALRIAAATSGHTVLVSGFTVMVAMAGMFFSGLLLFKGFAVATIVVVFIAMLGSVTVLPAMLSWLGDRVDKGRLPFVGRRAQRRAGRATSGGVVTKLIKPVVAKPKVFAVLAAALLVVLGAPALGMKTEQLGLEKQFGKDAEISVSFGEITDTFPGGPTPAQVVMEADVTSPEFRGAVADFKKKASETGEFGKAIEVVTHRDKGVAEIDVPLAGNGSDSDSKRALETLREDVVPSTLADATEKVYVTGDLASSEDFNDQLKAGIVPVFLFIIAMTFVLMLVCFRSVPIAVVSIVLNLLSVAAAYGVMVAVFQHGWGAETLGMEKAGAIESWMPLFVLVILFGLSMDYHVFVVSRIREAHDRGRSTREAITEGIQATAGSITGAAAIMVAVFGVFAMLSMQDMQQMGVGLAVAVLLDATVVRMVLLPSVMALLGEKNWYLPRWLDWLPHFSHGEEPTEPATRPLAAQQAMAATSGAYGQDHYAANGHGYGAGYDQPHDDEARRY
ncbi:MMPL family transporter [Streptomyces zagrosensis]|uniref:RND superfamily putative drug exporter n=1 Tax=Streptomyces zagrosensis TaxID=1042984 RepID=A0A7W9Q491_9ACTN|nr:MMPL family transporter [Streptomyces zagrosensis]MBB5933349.1 RND superfamily putative drug exporter [Streptomyces zagrosensis]